MAGIVALLLAGCAVPRPAPAVYVQAITVEQNAERARTMSDLDMTKRQLKLLQDRPAITRSPIEEQRTRAEIVQLEARIDELELKLAEMPALDRSGAEPMSSVGAGTGASYIGSPVYTGPRGGRYKISPSGKKQYIRRK